MTGAGLVLLMAVVGSSAMATSAAGESLTRNTVRLSLAWYFVGLCLMIQTRQTAPAPANSEIDRSAAELYARWCWTWGCLTFLVHVAMAMHFYHHWSQAAAMEHTRAVSGVGEGIYFSYLFVAVWTGDVLLWWLAPQRRAERPAWVNRALHAFMLFIVFNGTVIYESGPIRWAGLIGFLTLAMLWLNSFRSPRVMRA